MNFGFSDILIRVITQANTWLEWGTLQRQHIPNEQARCNQVAKTIPRICADQRWSEV